MIALTQIELRGFELTLREAIAWCVHKAAISRVPETKREGSHWSRPGPDTWCCTPELNPSLPDFHRSREEYGNPYLIQTTLERIRSTRRDLLKKHGLTLFQSALDKSNGQLLVSVFQDTLWDTAAAAVSGGLFDDGERPSGDTWVACITEEYKTNRDPWPCSAIISWIPQTWFEAASDGISVAPVGNLRWLSDKSLHFEQRLALQLKEFGIFNPPQ